MFGPKCLPAPKDNLTCILETLKHSYFGYVGSYSKKPHCCSTSTTSVTVACFPQASHFQPNLSNFMTTFSHQILWQFLFTSNLNTPTLMVIRQHVFYFILNVVLIFYIHVSFFCYLPSFIDICENIDINIVIDCFQ